MRKKKYPRLPNGYGQIRKLSGNRRNPYGVYPPQVEEDQDGRRLPVKALCYVNSWSVGFAVLTALKAGTYTPGLENELMTVNSPEDLLADYARLRRYFLNQPEVCDPTFADVYKLYFRDKYESGKEYSVSARRGTQTAFANCKSLHDKSFRSLRLDDLQAVVDTCPLKHASLELIVSLIKQMYRYADAHELCDRDYGLHVKIKKADDDEHGVPFTEDELSVLWDHSDDPTAEMVLIMCYAGYRVSAYKDIVVNLEEKSFFGGNKTISGKGVLCPIHSAIYPLVKRRIERDGCMMADTQIFRKQMYSVLASFGLAKHTPHDCKHTFSALCERYGVNEHDRKRMLGHKIGDITNDVYGHRTLEELRSEIEKIDLSKACQKRD